MLVGRDVLAVLHMPGESTEDDLLHNLPWYGSQAGRPVVPQIHLLALLVDGHRFGKSPII